MANESRGRDWDALTGVGFVVLTVAALALPGAPPPADAPASEVVRYFSDKRTDLLASSVLWFLAAILLLWFYGVLRSHMHAAERDDRLSATALGGGLFGAVFLTASFCSPNAAAFAAATADADPRMLKALYDLGGALFTMAGIGFAVFYFATAMVGWRARSLPRWLCVFAAVLAAVQLLYTVSLMARHGPLANGGALGLVEPLLSLVWFFVVSCVLFFNRAQRTHTIA